MSRKSEQDTEMRNKLHLCNRKFHIKLFYFEVVNKLHSNILEYDFLDHFEWIILAWLRVNKWHYLCINSIIKLK